MSAIQVRQQYACVVENFFVFQNHIFFIVKIRFYCGFAYYSYLSRDINPNINISGKYLTSLEENLLPTNIW